MVIAIGIDLGTTYSCVAVKRGDKDVEIIPNEVGERVTPSYVAFTDEERLIGTGAKNQASRNPTNTIFDAKRLIGRKYDDPWVREDAKLLSYKIKRGEFDNIQIQAEYMNKKELFRPEQISAMVLTKMKEIAESYLGCEVENAVITVPAYFNDAQRSATVDAGTIAGLKVLRILDEPTSAAIAYGLQSRMSDTENKVAEERCILVVDIGGGTTDLSLLETDTGVIEVIATSGDSHFGGEDFDSRLVDYCITMFKKKNKVKILRDSKAGNKAIRKLRTACEKAKKELSLSHRTVIEIDSLYDGEDFNLDISRAKFDELCSQDFAKITELLDEVLADSKRSKSEIDEIVLVGGSTRIPKIQTIISEYFNNKKLNKELHPDEAVAYGAAVKAYDICAPVDEETDTILLMDVTPLSLGIETAGGVMNVIIPRGTTKPVKRTQEFSTYENNQKGVTIKIFEGEREFTKDNNLLGKFHLSGIPPAPKGVPQIEVSFEIDVNGILSISARDKATNNEEKLEVENAERLSTEEMEAMFKKSEEMRERDTQRKLIIEARDRLEDLIYTISEYTSSQEQQISEEERKELKDTIKDAREWLENYDIDDADLEQVQEKIRETEGFCDPILTKLYEQKLKKEEGIKEENKNKEEAKEEK